MRVTMKLAWATAPAIAVVAAALPASADAYGRITCGVRSSQYFCEATNYPGEYKHTAGIAGKVRDHVCAGGKTPAGSIKDGSSCSTGATDGWKIAITHPNQPEFFAYGVWVGGVGNALIDTAWWEN